MTKNQKIWLGVFLAMFLVPEVLWSPIGNFYYELFQSGNVYPFRNNFLTNSDNFGILKSVFLVQFIGILMTLFIVLVGKINKLAKVLLTCLFLFFVWAVGFVVLFAYYNNPQIG